MGKYTRKSVAVFAGVGVVLVGAGAAFAYWTAGGTGTGEAETGTVSDIIVNQTSIVSAMAPGDSPQTLTGNFDNVNDGPVFVTTVTASISSVTKDPAAAVGTCDATDYTLVGAAMPVGVEVPSGDGVGAWTGATIQFNNKPGTNQDACQGATVGLTYTAA